MSRFFLVLPLLLAGCVHQENWSDVEPVRATASDPYIAVLTGMREVTGDVPYFVRGGDAATQADLLAIRDELAGIRVYTDAEQAAAGETPASVQFRDATRDDDGNYRGEIFALLLDPETMTGGTDTWTYVVRCRSGSCSARLEFKSEGVIVPQTPDSAG